MNLLLTTALLIAVSLTTSLPASDQEHIERKDDSLPNGRTITYKSALRSATHYTESKRAQAGRFEAENGTEKLKGAKAADFFQKMQEQWQEQQYQAYLKQCKKTLPH